MAESTRMSCARPREIGMYSTIHNLPHSVQHLTTGETVPYFVSPPAHRSPRQQIAKMPGADNVYMAKLAEQAERYEEMVRAHSRRRTAPLSPPPRRPHPLSH